ncbi:MAG: GNAT family N-acetyltransferase [Crocinitomicaceae bacterium]|nr:GNAT family N-acetyltransferase [Crocinitomicaceae bacterium]
MIIREAIREDVPAILELIKGLAEYEKEPHEVANTVENLSKDIFENKYCEALVAVEDGVIGFAIYYTSYSTWKGACIYLEDLYVLPESRGTGAGSKLFDAVVDIAKERKVARMDWQVLDWNEIAIDFYKRKGATLDEEWINGRLFFRENEG